MGFQIVEAKDVYYQPSWRTAIEMVDQNLPGSDAITLGADKTYDTPRICRDLPGAQCHSHLSLPMTTVWAVRPWMAERCAIPAIASAGKTQAGGRHLRLDQGTCTLPAHQLSGPRSSLSWQWR